MKKILLDTNVILDVLLDRKPHVEASSLVWSAIEQNRVSGFLSAHAVTTLHFLLRREIGAGKANRVIGEILSAAAVSAVDEGVIRSALALAWPDFEDAVTASSAQASGCHAIVSRDPKGFKHSPVAVLTPEAAAAWISSKP